MDGAEGISAPTKTAKKFSAQPETNTFVEPSIQQHPCVPYAIGNYIVFLAAWGEERGYPKASSSREKGTALRVVASGLVRCSSALPRLDDYFDSTVPERDRHIGWKLRGW
ncbi:predicted protein [Verticillium alfalfae VaMs.102]|uniref:Predicted protein n=1 Tax=Verticillium alfalfae (strain VaMs.102 / ATCC MYA-4576 / FGSC 10136) TaxID=526221 RepID=C9S7C6_VERA1|nr:predicted protein [Verticillium alfalfae VaMs.102]EEY14711.1 predicted protein [Verticillium alfalfae VaMs.102]